VPTPDYQVVQNSEDVKQVMVPYPLFVKPVAEGTGKGITAASRVNGPPALAEICGRLLADFHQPVLVERYLSGREFTVGITGTGKAAASLGVLEIMLNKDADTDVYSYDNKEWCEERVTYRLADDAEARAAETTALAAWRALGCRDGGRVDLRSDDKGLPHFMEVNPLAGLHPEHSDLPILCSQRGIPYRRLIELIMESACRDLAGRVRVLRTPTGA
jgi:D-alanine-D-alanine ligase